MGEEYVYVYQLVLERGLYFEAVYSLFEALAERSDEMGGGRGFGEGFEG